MFWRRANRRDCQGTKPESSQETAILPAVPKAHFVCVRNLYTHFGQPTVRSASRGPQNRREPERSRERWGDRVSRRGQHPVANSVPNSQPTRSPSASLVQAGRHGFRHGAPALRAWRDRARIPASQPIFSFVAFHQQIERLKPAGPPRSSFDKLHRMFQTHARSNLPR